MDAKLFIRAIKEVVRDAAARNALSILEQPPGRRPSPELKARADWYHSLDDSQKKLLADAIKEAANGAVFGFLCVLDGVRAIEDDKPQGVLELRYVKGNISFILNPPDETMLHDLFNSP